MNLRLRADSAPAAEVEAPYCKQLRRKGEARVNEWLSAGYPGWEGERRLLL